MITTFEGARFSCEEGSEIRVDEDFVPSMERVGEFAETRGVKVYVTQSLRDPKKAVGGAVVKPAVMSNHLVGHGIDFNVIAADGTWCNSGAIGRMNHLPEEVSGFIQDIRDDPDLRWGGDFRTPDVIHFDDKLNKRDPDEWWLKFNSLWIPTTGTGDSA